MQFTHKSFSQRVTFAANHGATAVAEELAAIGATKVMLIASARDRPFADTIAEYAPIVLHHQEVVMHVPVEVAERARAAAETARADALVSVGGGSAVGLAKAVALTTDLPIVAVPTTYAGSEATHVWGVTKGNSKTTGIDARVLPRSVVYDAALLSTLPGPMAVASGLNAMAHGVDSMWGPTADPIDRALAQEGIRSLASGLPTVAKNSGIVEGIELTLYGTYLAAVAFASAGSGMHHKICHVLGGMFNLPHAQTHAVVLPHVLAFNAPEAPEADERISAALGSTTAVEELARLYASLNAPRALRDYGMPYDGIADAAAKILEVIPPNNPVRVTEKGLVTLLDAAWAGDRPA